MKRLAAILISLCLLVGLFTMVSADEMKTISVVGSGNVALQADMARVNLGIKTKDKNIGVAIENNKNLITKLVKELENFGIAKEDIATDFYSVNYFEDGRYEDGGYEVDNNLVVKLRDISKLSELIEFTSKHGVNNTRGFHLESSKIKEGYARATELAVENAREKAEKLAKLYGKTLGDVISIDDSGFGMYEYAAKNSLNENAKISGDMILSGNIEAIENIKVVFELK